jgi:hypothetical protein
MNPALLLLIAAFAGTQQAPPAFDQFPAGEIFHGTPARPILKSRGQRLFRTRIRDAAKQGPNFAGRYRIAEWGCGAACVSIAVVDEKTGEVYEGPFGKLPGSVIYFGPEIDPKKAGLFFHLDSRLMIALGCPQETGCAEYYYEWMGTHFRLLRKDALHK